MKILVRGTTQQDGRVTGSVVQARGVTKRFGEVRAADPDQLVTAILVTLDGLSRLPVSNPDRFHQHFPDARIVLGLLLPAAQHRAE
jgi:hypothetical protein